MTFTDEQMATWTDLELDVCELSKLIAFNLHQGINRIGIAKALFEELCEIVAPVPVAEIVAITNKIGVEDYAAGWIVKAWSTANGFNYVTLEFETATVNAGAGEGMEYRRSKKTWGNLVFISETTVDGEQIRFGLKENNPIRLKQTTRNEVKNFFSPSLVNNAMRMKKGDFVESVDPAERHRVERIAGRDLAELWRAIRQGDAALVAHLSRIPSAKREEKRKRGMYVAPAPQLDLFAA